MKIRTTVLMVLLLLVSSLFATNMKVAILDFAKKDSDSDYVAKAMMKRDFKTILKSEKEMALIDLSKSQALAKKSGYTNLFYADIAERNGLNPDSLMLFGQEKNLNTWAISKMSLFLHDIDDARIERGDTLRDPKHVSDEKTVMKFDLVMANPPFSMKNWGHEVWSKGDPFGRDKYGCPPKSYGDLAFVQHMIASLKPSGRMACVVPHGVLFRGGAEGKIRKGILEDDLIEAVVGLGPNLFYGTGIPAAILFVNRAKAAERRGSIIIVNGSEELVEGKKQNHLSDENVARMVGAVERWEDEELFCRVVSLDEIRENDHNLNLTRYVQTTPPPPPIDVAEEWRKLQELMAERDEAERRMTEFIEELGYGRRS